MDHNKVGRMWDENAEAWTRLSRMGYDIFRDHVNTPAFLRMLPDINGLAGLDIGCGEGHHTRLFAGRGGKMTAVDISDVFISGARQAENEAPLGIRYLLASAVELPFPDCTFDFAVATMSFMDAPEHERVIGEACRVLRPGGFLQFSITHPCFQTPRWNWVYDQAGNKIAVECGDYFFPPSGEIEEWIFPTVPPAMQQGFRKFRIPVFRRTLSSWMNLLIDSGFVLEHFCEPYADKTAVALHPALEDTRKIAFFLIVRCRKSAAET